MVECELKLVGFNFLRNKCGLCGIGGAAWKIDEDPVTTKVLISRSAHVESQMSHWSLVTRLFMNENTLLIKHHSTALEHDAKATHSIRTSYDHRVPHTLGTHIH